MSESKHTPGKLSLNNYHYPHAYLVIRKGSEDNDAFPRPRKICDVTLDGKTEEEYEANAHRLVKCWNSHAALLDNLKKANQELTRCRRTPDYAQGQKGLISALQNELEAVIAQAENELLKDLEGKYPGMVLKRLRDVNTLGDSEELKDRFQILSKDIDYGYAITAHKSQGSTYKYVFLDEKLMFVCSKSEENRLRWRHNGDRNLSRYSALVINSIVSFVII